MKTWKRALALVLALVMALSLMALPSFAAGGDESAGDTGMPYINGQGGTVEQNGLVMSKTIKKGENGQFLLTLEAYATGSTTTTTSTKPVDIVLVLDVSGSMENSISDKYDHYETYSIDTDGTYYYKDNNGQYQQAYYCDGEYSWGWKSYHTPGWYTKDHQYLGQCQGESGTRLTPKTSSADTAGTQFYTYSKLTKMDALKSAVNSFIDGVAEKSPDSKVAVVKFAGYKRDSVGNDFYQKGGYTYNYTQIVKELTTADVAGANVLKAAVNSFEAAGATSADYGMQHAKTIIDDAKDDGRQKVVVMFTDGEPTHSSGGDFNTVANAAIFNSKSIKDAKATVYTIGCFGTLTGDTKTKVDTYMDYVSSNYPNATSMTSGGTKADPANYYKTVSSAADLNNIFQDISHTVGGTTVTLTSTSVLRDVISDSFKLPAGADKSSIKAYSVDCLSKNSDGSYSWQDKSAWTAISPENIELTDNNKTINVTGFDYAANWVDQFGVNGSQSHGKKLVVQIPIVPETTAYGDCDTNGPASGIYATGVDGEEPVQTFPSPKVYIPYFTVVHVASTVNDQGHNEGKRTGETHHPVWCSRPFNLTSVVTNGYLYGGSFNGVDCTKVQTYAAGENPTDFTPVAGETYYIWEVPDRYLRPFAFWVSSHLVGGNGALTVTQMYLLSEVDRLLYRDAGLKVKIGDKGQWNVISSNCSELIGDTGVNNDKATVYQRLEYFQMPNLNEVVETWYLQKGNVKDQQGGLTMRDNANPLDQDDQVVDDGYITGHRLTSDELELALKGNNVTYKPYWVTLDGVHVEGIRERTYSIQPSVKEPKNLTPAGKYVEPVYNYVGTVGTQTMLALRASMLVNESEPAVENVTVTVVDAAKTYELTVSAGTGVRDQVAYQAPAGKVFAGWFADQAYTTPADLDQVTQDTTIYAKYVSDSYLDLAYSRTGLFRLRGVTLISAVDNPANYQASGFIVGDQKVDVSYAGRYRIFKTPANLFGAARDAKLMLADKSLSGTGTLEVTPYWVTLDGTEVHGVTHTLHYNTRTIWE